MKTILTVENIEKYYGNRSNITKAVDNISFSVDEGEFIGVMGPSGSGKTTLLNCISTIDNVTSGHIYINGKDITKLKKNDLSSFRRKELGFIFQDFNLLDTLTTYENIALALTIQKIKPSQIGKRIESVAKKTGHNRCTAEVSVSDVRRSETACGISESIDYKSESDSGG